MASFMPRSLNSCNKVDASDARASRRLVCTVARERRTFSLRDLCLWHSPPGGECHSPNLLSAECQTVSRSGTHKSRVHKQNLTTQVTFEGESTMSDAGGARAGGRRFSPHPCRYICSSGVCSPSLTKRLRLRRLLTLNFPPPPDQMLSNVQLITRTYR